MIGVYEQRSDLNSGHLTQTEVHLYGSSRLGIFSINRDMITPPDGEITTFERGRKFFELSNHLGNVLVTVSDRKIQVQDPNNTTQILYYKANVVTATDYYPFGMMMPGRKFEQSGKGYRYSINGQEKEKELNENTTSAEFWMYDSRIGRRWNVDPKPNASVSVFAVFGNSPIWFSDNLGDTIDVKGSITFRNRTQSYLQKIAQTDRGKAVIERLQNSTEHYTIKEVFLVTNSQYNSNNTTISYDDYPWRKKLGGGHINGMIVLAHELYHAYDDDMGFRAYRDKRGAETVASYFQNYISSVYGCGDMRTSYPGVGIFPSNESEYNPKMEKITNYKVEINPIDIRPKEVVLGNSRSDNTTVRLQIQPITDPATTIIYDKTYTIGGKEVKQSFKKGNQKKLAKEK